MGCKTQFTCRKSIINMSISGKAVNHTIRNAAASGLHMSVAAGNQAPEACNYSLGIISKI